MSEYSDILANAKLAQVAGQDAADAIMKAAVETEVRLHKRQVVITLALEDAKAVPVAHGEFTGPVDPDLSAKSAEAAGQ